MPYFTIYCSFICDVTYYKWLPFQIVILVVDSTDRERLTVTKEELHRMLAHEVLLYFKPM